MFPDPEIVCKYLDFLQWEAVSWILELLVRTLDGVKVLESELMELMNRKKDDPCSMKDLMRVL